MNKVDIIQALFDKYFIAKQDTIALLEQSGASPEQIDGFKRRNASQSPERGLNGFPYWEKEVKYAGKPESKARNKSSVQNDGGDPTKQKVIF